MTCDQAQELITALADNELPASERASIDGHLEECGNCRAGYAREAALKQAVRSAGATLTAPKELREKILSDRRAFLPRAVTEQAPRLWTMVFTRPAFALALLVLVLLPVIYLMRSQGPSLGLAAVETHDKIIRH